MVYQKVLPLYQQNSEAMKTFSHTTELYHDQFTAKVLDHLNGEGSTFEYIGTYREEGRMIQGQMLVDYNTPTHLFSVTLTDGSVVKFEYQDLSEEGWKTKLVIIKTTADQIPDGEEYFCNGAEIIFDIKK